MSVADLAVARVWCDNARRLLSIASVPGSDRYQMGKRLDKVEKALNGLRAIAATEELRTKHKEFVARFKGLGATAHAIDADERLAQAEKVVRVKRVSDGLSLLGSQISLATAEARGANASALQAEVNRAELPVQKAAFDEAVEMVRERLTVLAGVATLDDHRAIRDEIEGMISAVASGRPPDYVPGKARIAAKTSEVNARISAAAAQQGTWTRTASARTELERKLPTLADTGYFGGEKAKMTQNLHMAKLNGDTLHNYPEAVRYWEMCSAMMTDVEARKSAITAKMSDFTSTRQGAAEALLAETQRQLDELQAAFKRAASGASASVPDGDVSVLGPAGVAQQRLRREVDKYQADVASGAMEAWGGYPGALEAAMTALTAARGSLTALFGGPDQAAALTREAERLVNQHNAGDALAKLNVEMEAAKADARAKLERLLGAIGPLHAEYTRCLAKFDGAVAAYAAAPAKAQVTALKKVAAEAMERLAWHIAEKTRLLARKADLVARWNAALRFWSDAPTKYTDGLSKEWDVVANAYLTSDNIETIRTGIEKLEVLVTRMAAVEGDASAVKACLKTFKEINTALNTSANAALKANQPTKLVELQAECKTFSESGAVNTEDPATLAPKLNALKAKVGAASTAATRVAALRTGIQEAFAGLTAQFAQAKVKLNSIQGQVPNNCVTSFESEAAGILQAAIVDEDAARLDRRKAEMANVKLRLTAFLRFNATQLQQHFEQTELPHITVEIAKDEQKAKNKKKWDEGIAKFTNEAKPACKEALGWGQYYGLPGFENKMKSIDEKEKVAKQQAADEDFAAAVASLNVAFALAEDLIRSPEGSGTAPSLAGLDVKWEAAVTGLTAALAALPAKVKAECAKESTDAPALANLETKLQAACARLAPLFQSADFKRLIVSLQGDTVPNRRGVAEKALQDVRRWLKVVQTNPLLLELVGNPFNVRVPSGDLYRALRSLEVNLLKII